MKQIKKYSGISSALLKNGYSTSYFTTHDSQFDNVEGFLRANDFENIISQLDYPMNEVKTTLGVPDDYMFRFSIQKIDELHKKGNPFFATFMTASDHGPYYIPDYFHPKSDKLKNQIVEYADWSLKKFFELSSKQKWFDNTIFVFVADHGAPISSNYEISLSYFHSPFIVYAPKKVLSKRVYKKIGSQIDIFPTIMGLINQPYINNTLGIDLLRENRKYAVINNDSKIGILDTSYFCIMGQERINLYKYKTKDKTDYVEEESEKAEEMTLYAKSIMQTYQEMLLNDDITIKEKGLTDK
jgi:phosphoglycerol transferase MdoB-like AlkP superfamily enzyme